MRLIVFFGLLRTDVNKSQDRQSQSRPGALIRRRSDDVLQPEPRDASPRLFSVNSALSRPSIPTGHWCCRKAFNVSLPPRTFTVCVVVLSPFEAPEKSLPPPRRESPLTRHSTADVAQREGWAISLSCFLDCILITSEKSPSTRLSMSHMLMTHHFASLGESPFIAYAPTSWDEDCNLTKMVHVPGSLMAVGHFIILMAQSKVSWWGECFFSGTGNQTGDNQNKKQKSDFIDRKHLSVKWNEVWMLSSINTIHHWLTLIPQLFNWSPLSSCWI